MLFFLVFLFSHVLALLFSYFFIYYVIIFLRSYFLMFLFSHFYRAWVSTTQERVGLEESLRIHQMLSACLEETIIRNINYIAGDSDFQDRNRYNHMSDTS